MDAPEFRSGEYLTFRLGGQEFAIDAKHVKGIVPMHDMEAADDDGSLLGHAKLQGYEFAVINLAGHLKLRPGERGRSPCIVVIDGVSVIGFPVDGVSGIVMARAHDYRHGKLRIGRPRRILDADALTKETGGA